MIAGQTAPEDYLAQDETGRSIGRVYRHHMGGWFWTFNAFGPDISWLRFPAIGVEANKQEAVKGALWPFYSGLGKSWRAITNVMRSPRVDGRPVGEPAAPASEEATVRRGLYTREPRLARSVTLLVGSTPDRELAGSGRYLNPSLRRSVPASTRFGRRGVDVEQQGTLEG